MASNVVRIPIGKSLRFQVLTRDNFTCQYCGARGPNVTLEIDHIHPVKDGGQNDLRNLITACHDCNSGKGCRPLGDATSSIIPVMTDDEKFDAIEKEIGKFTHHTLGSRGSAVVDNLVGMFPVSVSLFAVRASFYKNFYAYSTPEALVRTWHKSLSEICLIALSVQEGHFPIRERQAILALDVMLKRFGRQSWGHMYEHILKAFELGLEHKKLLRWVHTVQSFDAASEELLAYVYCREEAEA